MFGSFGLQLKIVLYPYIIGLTCIYAILHKVSWFGSMCTIMAWSLVLDYITFQPGVTGPRCDQCAVGRFNLDANNPDGCSKCWCNGLSDSCDSGNKYW